jgi:putative SOS response-associated peptidase YedK
MADVGQMVMAGLWAKWKDPKSGDEIQSCTILTCGPNDAIAELHNRMPVILREADWPKWLGEEPATEEELPRLHSRTWGGIGWICPLRSSHSVQRKH